MAKLKNIPILMYHHVLEKNKIDDANWGSLYVDIKEFEKQAGFLKSAGYTTIDFAGLAAIIDGKVPPPKKPVIIVFDDAYEASIANVAPVLENYRQKAVVALVTGCVGGTDTWDKACKETYDVMKEDEVELYNNEETFSFESHTVTHPHFKDIGAEKLEYELKESKRYLEKLLAKPVNALIYPYGEYNKDVKEAVKRAGYKFGVAVQARTSSVLVDPYELRRVYIKSTDSLGAFKRKISGWYLWYRGLRRR